MTAQLPAKGADLRPVFETDLATEANHRIANNLESLTAMLRNKIASVQTGPETVPRDQMVTALTDVTANIVAVSRLHRRLTMRPTEGQVDLHAVLLDILREFEASRLFGDRLRIEPSLSSGCMVEAADSATLTLAFSEIVTNAIKYAHPTGLPVELSVASDLLADGSIALQISDDGVGFPEGFREDRDAGVGLRLVRALVESVGGRLSIQSDPLGLVFSILLPRANGQHH
jgi:two-component sensor histidine kinase